MTGNHISYDLLHSVDIVIKASHAKYTKQHIITLYSQGKLHRVSHHQTQKK